jgi:peptidyl-prolyl cis-trans isomerase SurA
MITSARESGMRVDDAEVDRAVQNIAQQNQITMPVLRERLKKKASTTRAFAPICATRS